MSAERRESGAEEFGLEIQRSADGQLRASRGSGTVRVRVVRCFPWSSPTEYVSLRDDDDGEVALVRDLEELDPDSRSALREALFEAGFVFEVTGVDALDEEVEIRCWKVRTRHGARSFQTALDAWPQRAPDGGLLVEDVQGDVFWIPPAERLDTRSRKLLWGFLD